MTERKICTEVEGKWEDGEWIPDKWVPLDPQPCCDNCYKITMCEVYKFVRDELDTASSSFYCSDWKVKQ
jgi:hypothetical protein